MTNNVTPNKGFCIDEVLFPKDDPVQIKTCYETSDSCNSKWRWYMLQNESIYDRMSGIKIKYQHKARHETIIQNAGVESSRPKQVESLFSQDMP
jgi:hypothetical protein